LNKAVPKGVLTIQMSDEPPHVCYEGLVYVGYMIRGTAKRSSASTCHSCGIWKAGRVCSALDSYTWKKGVKMRRTATMLAVAALLVALSAGAALATTLVGTSGNDRLVGTSSDDRIVGNGGDDALEGVGGDNRVGGGPGDDRVEGQGGDDTVEGGGGTDLLRGGTGDDRLDGVSGEVVARGDEIHCGDGNDSVEATRNDFVASDCEMVRFLAAGSALAALPLIVGTDHAEQIKGTNNTEEIRGLGGSDEIVDGRGRDAVYGGGGADNLIGYGGDTSMDRFFGGGGNDTVQSRDIPAMKDYVGCGTGEDQVYADKADVVSGNCEKVSIR
jgi:Ca2+-binding RTX toxin-like protein